MIMHKTYTLGKWQQCRIPKFDICLRTIHFFFEYLDAALIIFFIPFDMVRCMMKYATRWSNASGIHKIYESSNGSSEKPMKSLIATPNTAWCKQD